MPTIDDNKSVGEPVLMIKAFVKNDLPVDV